MEVNGRRIKFNGEARHATDAALGKKHARFATGGRVHQYPRMKYGAATGQGRLEKAKAYGIKGPK